MFELPEKFRDGDYPRSWDEFIGQTKAKQQLQLAAKSARIRHAPLEHTLIADGRPGVGKTAMALLAAAEMGSRVGVASGRVSAGRARILMCDLQDGDILFIDEMHRMVEGGKGNAEWLLNYLQDGLMPDMYAALGEVPKVTIIGATTDAGKLPETITSRFGLVPQLTEYKLEEAADVVLSLSFKVLGDLVELPSSSNCVAIAEASNRNPRAIRRLLVSLRDLAITDTISYGPDGYPMADVFEWHGVTPDGLDLAMQRYLLTLVRKFGGQAGEKALMDALQEPGGLREVERVLCDRGFVVKTRTGRQVTTNGIRRAKQLAE